MRRIDEEISEHSAIDTLRLGLWTAFHLQPKQLRGMLERKVRHAIFPRLPVDFDARYERQIPHSLQTNLEPLQLNSLRLRDSLDPQTRASYGTKLDRFRGRRLSFLGHGVDLNADRTIEFTDDQLSEVPLLWWLKYQSLEPLEWAVFGDVESADVVEVAKSVLIPWTRTMSSTTEIGSPAYLRRDWIPHAVSLRIIRLCRFSAWLSENNIAEGRKLVLRYLYKNALFLYNHIENDIGGNHLVENALALTLAGIIFEDNDDWCATGVETLKLTAASQFFNDGGHYERSPMYHIMVLRRFFSAVDVLRSDGREIPPVIRTTAIAATDFLKTLRPPDGKIPLLNDSVFNEVLSVSEALRYASTVGVSNASVEKQLEPSGYYWLGQGPNCMLVDTGAVGPVHLPGHSHVGLMNILLWLDGHRVFTDTGVFQYISDRRRQYGRSVYAHNSLQVGDSEPIEVAGQYLMGRRTEPKVIHEEIDDDSPVESLSGEYTVSPYRGASYSHQRRIDATDTWWLVRDSVKGRKGRQIVSRLHTHPDITLRNLDAGKIEIANPEGDLLGVIYPIDGTEFTTKESPYFPEYGREIRRSALEAMFEGETGGFLITKLNQAQFDYDFISNQVIVDGEIFSLPEIDVIP